MYDQGSSKEKLLYDFSLNEGDTFGSSWGGTGRYYLSVIENIDTFQLNGKEHLIYYPVYDMEQRAPYIEGVGSVAGPFESTYFFEGGSELVCLMTGKDQIPYFTYPPNSCELYHYTGLDETSFPQGSVIVRPNPLQENSVIELLSETDAIIHVSIFSMTGSLIYKSDVSHIDQFPLGNILLNKGVYCYHVLTENGSRYAGRIVK